MEGIKNYINFGTICIIATLSVYHLFIYLGRSQFKTEFYNLLFALAGISAVMHIASVNYFPDGKITICLVALFVFLSLNFFPLLTIFNLIQFPPPAVLIFKIGIAISLLNVIIIIPLTLIMGRPWYFKYLYLPGTIIFVAAGLIHIMNSLYFIIALSLWKDKITNLVFIALVIYGINAVISGVCHFVPFLSFFKYNYMFTGVFYIILAIGITSKFNLEFKELKELKDNLEDQVTQRTLQLKQAHTEIKQLSEQKNRFFINFAHETKTPLTLIKNYLDAFVEKKRLFKDRDMCIIRDSVLKLEINMLNFLDSEKIERGEMVHRHDQVLDLSAFLTDKLKLFEPVFKKKSFSLRSKIDKDIYLKADSHALDRVLNNLFDNAVKYTSYYGKINVTLKKTPRKIDLLITNTGVGILESELEHIFKPYYQLSREKNNNEGMGMGLYIVKNIIDSLEGKIKITGGDGKMTRVLINLPAYDQKNSAAVSAYEQEKPLDIAVLDLDPDRNRPGQKNILLVEDDLNLIGIMYETLKEDYNVYYALHGEDALQKLNRYRIDMIVSDIMMNVMDGYQLIKSVPPHLRHIPFLFVTAKATQKDKMEGLAFGAVDFIFKPFSMAELKLKIQSHLEMLDYQVGQFRYEIAHEMDNPEGLRPAEVFDILCYQFDLTDLEKKIVLFLKDGKENKDVAEAIGISREQVHAHIKQIYRKTRVHNRMQLFKRMQFFV